MNFISLSFLVLFFISLVFRFSIGREGKSPLYLHSLLFFSLLFYSWHTPWYLLIAIYVCLVSFISSYFVSGINKKIALYASIFLLLIPLLLFKYYDFTVVEIVSPLWNKKLDTMNFLLPIGISFYTFQAISYLIDIYRGKISRTNFENLALYIFFFPQLVAGPIVKAKDFLYQIKRKRSVNSEAFWYGAYLILQGYFFKFVCADNLAPLVDRQWKIIAQTHSFSLGTIIVIVGFSFQIFYDFSGYTNIARGIAYQLGFRLPENFRNPYIASTFSDFWRRWHISLSEWFRDYVYIPLGGSRKGQWRTILNLFFVMLLCGLWHGAAWTFIIWGCLHGLFLAVERCIPLNRVNIKKVYFLWYLIVQFSVLIAWIYFRADTVQQAGNIVSSLFNFSNINLDIDRHHRKIMYFLIPGILMHAFCFFNEHQIKFLFQKKSLLYRSALAGIFMYFICSCYGTSANFIYFQF